MFYKKIFFAEIAEKNVGKDSYFEIYLNEKNKDLNIEPRLPMIVVPGGGYNYCSSRESEPIALRYMAEGFNCFTITYSCKVSYPLPYFELAILVDYIKKNADSLNVDASHISMVGFSAGGHLASSFALLHKELEKELSLPSDYLKPFSLVLAYPVASMILDTNSSTREIITGNSQALISKLTVPENVDETYPATYIWSTKEDQCVPVKHSTMLFEALKDKKVSTKCTIFDHGIHGGALCNHSCYNNDFNFEGVKENKKWVDESVEFIYSLLDKE